MAKTTAKKGGKKKGARKGAKKSCGMSASKASRAMREGSKAQRSAAAKALSKRSPRSNVKNPKTKRREGQPFTSQEDQQLRDLASGNTPTRVIGLKLGRMARSIYRRASELGVSLAPPNRSPRTPKRAKKKK